MQQRRDHERADHGCVTAHAASIRGQRTRIDVFLRAWSVSARYYLERRPDGAKIA